MIKTIEQTIYNMMVTSTGTAICDSGFGERGRAWQRNQIDYPTIADIQKVEPATIDTEYLNEDGETDVVPNVNVYHHLVNTLDINSLCEQFNALPCEDWDSEKAYGLSLAQQAWLENNGLHFGDTWNSSNGDSNLSQTLQGCNITEQGNESNFEFPTYILLQIHQGADVRGGYTDAKLFKVTAEYFTTNPTVYGTIDGIECETSYNGYSLTTENGDAVTVKRDSVINLTVSEF